MATITFKDLSFSRNKNKGSIRFHFLKSFHFDAGTKELERIGKTSIKGNGISFEGASESEARLRLNKIIDKGLENLKSGTTGKKAIYIHSNSGIPLIGSIDFGIIDRNTNLIEVRPVTGCNLNCIYCSVNEGKSSPKTAEFVVEKDYLASEFRKLAEQKNCEIEAHINAQGEPMTYGPITELVRNLKAIKNVKTISIDTNATLLDKKNVDELIKAGLTRFNVSLNATDEKTAKKMCGTAKYDIKKVIEIINYISKQKCELLLAPVWVHGFNDDEIPKIILLGKKLGAKVGVQNFLNYPHGRNPAKQMEWEGFYSKLKEWEKEFGMKLILTADTFSIKKTEKLKAPFKKGQTIEATTVCEGRNPEEMTAVAENRTIKMLGCKTKGRIRAKIIRTKHNIFMAKCLK